MGEIADDMIDGFMCSWCGVYFENDHGYPVACDSCWEDALEDIKDGKKYEVQKENGKITMISGVQKHIEPEI